MKVSDLIAALENLDPDMEVILQKDGEGNGFSPLAGADPDCIYVAENTWAGEVYDVNWSADDAGYDEDEWETLLEVSPRALVLFPID